MDMNKLAREWLDLSANFQAMRKVIVSAVTRRDLEMEILGSGKEPTRNQEWSRQGDAIAAMTDVIALYATDWFVNTYPDHADYRNIIELRKAAFEIVKNEVRDARALTPVHAHIY
jgi:hypothetical protein